MKHFALCFSTDFTVGGRWGEGGCWCTPGSMLMRFMPHRRKVQNNFFRFAIFPTFLYSLHRSLLVALAFSSWTSTSLPSCWSAFFFIPPAAAATLNSIPASNDGHSYYVFLLLKREYPGSDTEADVWMETKFIVRTNITDFHFIFSVVVAADVRPTQRIHTKHTQIVTNAEFFMFSHIQYVKLWMGKMTERARGGREVPLQYDVPILVACRRATTAVTASGETSDSKRKNDEQTTEYAMPEPNQETVLNSVKCARLIVHVHLSCLQLFTKCNTLHSTHSDSVGGMRWAGSRKGRETLHKNVGKSAPEILLLLKRKQGIQSIQSSVTATVTIHVRAERHAHMPELELDQILPNCVAARLSISFCLFCIFIWTDYNKLWISDGFFFCWLLYF